MLDLLHHRGSYLVSTALEDWTVTALEK